MFELLNISLTLLQRPPPHCTSRLSLRFTAPRDNLQAIPEPTNLYGYIYLFALCIHNRVCAAEVFFQHKNSMLLHISFAVRKSEYNLPCPLILLVTTKLQQIYVFRYYNWYS